MPTALVSSPPRRLTWALLVAATLTMFGNPDQALAANWSSGLRPLFLGVGASLGGELGTETGHGYGTITVGLRLIPISPELILREGFSGAPAVTKHHGNVVFGARFLFPGPPNLRPTARIGFSHRHDGSVDQLRAEPVKVLFGTSTLLTHRSGFETGGGIEATFGPKGIVGLYAQGTLVVLPHDTLAPVTGLFELGLALAIGPAHP